MIRFDATVDIGRPIDDVFAFIANFENMPRWNYHVTRVEKLTGGPITLGTRFHQVRRTDQQDYEITRLEHDHVIEITTTSSQPRLVMRFKLQQVDGPLD